MPLGNHPLTAEKFGQTLTWDPGASVTVGELLGLV